MAGTNPAPGSRIDLRIGATADGTLTGLDARLVFDTGAYIEWSIEGIAAVLIGGAYRWSAFDVRAYGVRTNRFGTGSYRGPGGPQAAFALESLIDELANKLGIDAIELRTRNLVAEGDQMVDGEPWPGLGTAAVLEAVRTHPLWQGRHDLPADEGVGVALGVWPGGKAPAAALCRLNADGSITITTGVVDMSGTTGAFQVIAAETFGIDPSRVEVVALDTDGAPAVAAQRRQRHHLFVGPGDPRGGGRRPAPDAGATPRSRWRSTRPTSRSSTASSGRSDRRIKGRPIAEFAEDLHDFSSEFPPIEGHASTVQGSLAPSTAAHIAHVRLDPETGDVTVLGYVVSQDVGRALNPALVEGQMRGAAAQGIGWALLRGADPRRRGPAAVGLVPRLRAAACGPVPDIDTLIVEVPAPDGPFGAKGIAEASVIPAGAAVASAIAAAGGPRLREMPMTARRVWAAAHEPGLTACRRRSIPARSIHYWDHLVITLRDGAAGAETGFLSLYAIT